MFLAFHVLSQLMFFAVDVFSSQRFLLFDVLSQSTFFPFKRFVPFGVFSFDVLSVNVFYHQRFLLQHFVGKPNYQTRVYSDQMILMTVRWEAGLVAWWPIRSNESWKTTVGSQGT
jgi:hypothetical protein